MRSFSLHTETGITTLVSSYLAAVAENEAAMKFMEETPNMPARQRSSALADIAKNNKSNSDRVAALRNVLAEAIKKMEDENVVAFFQLPGVIEDVVFSANMVKEERKEVAKRSAISKNIRQYAETLDKVASELLPKEVRAELVADLAKTLTEKAGLK